MCISMGTKTISISEEAYEILKSWKGERDSFSSVILKLSKKQNLLKYSGIISEKRGEELRSSIEYSRKKSRERYK